MSVTHAVTVNWSGSGGAPPLLSSNALTANAELNIDQVITAGAVNTPIIAAATKAHMVSIVILCTVAMTVKTNSTGSPPDTYSMAAGVPFVWNSSMPNVNPLTADLTEFFVSNPGAANGTFSVRILQNP